MYSYKIGIHRDIFSSYYDQFREKLVPDPRPWLRAKISKIEKNHCDCELTEDGVCSCHSPFNNPYPEVELIKQLSSRKPRLEPRIRDDFEAFLKTSLGWGKLLPSPDQGGGNLSIRKTEDFGDGKLSELNLKYKKPGVSTRALYARHNPRSKTLVGVIHGHGSSMQKTMGLDTPDYMNGLGGYLFKRHLMLSPSTPRALWIIAINSIGY